VEAGGFAMAAFFTDDLVVGGDIVEIVASFPGELEFLDGDEIEVDWDFWGEDSVCSSCAG
jgi:hypothetical protein